MDRKILHEQLTKTSRTVPLVGRLDGELYATGRDAFLNLASQSEEPIKILFDSVGGDSFLSLQLGDLMRILPCKFIGVVLEASSAACTILQFCNQRLAVQSGRFLIHKNTCTPDDKILRFRDDELFGQKMEKVLQNLRSLDSRLVELFIYRTGFSEDEVKKWFSASDDFLSSFGVQEALRRKLIDDIVADDFRLFPTGKPPETSKMP